MAPALHAGLDLVLALDEQAAAVGVQGPEEFGHALAVQPHDFAVVQPLGRRRVVVTLVGHVLAGVVAVPGNLDDAAGGAQEEHARGHGHAVGVAVRQDFGGGDATPFLPARALVAPRAGVKYRPAHVLGQVLVDGAGTPRQDGCGLDHLDAQPAAVVLPVTAFRVRSAVPLHDLVHEPG